MRRIAIAALIAVSTALPAVAADTDGRFAIKGAGLQTCEKFLAAWESRSGDLALYGGWIEGYVTGINQHVDKLHDLSPWQTTETLLGLTKLACEQAGDKTGFMRAFDRVVRLLLSGPLTEGSPVDAISHNGKGLPIYRSIVERLEKKLSDADYATGPVDGVFTRETATAIEAYQKDQGLDVTGLPDQQTLVRLFLN